jgi:hypothetical protein
VPGGLRILTPSFERAGKRRITLLRSSLAFGPQAGAELLADWPRNAALRQRGGISWTRLEVVASIVAELECSPNEYESNVAYNCEGLKTRHSGRL